MSTDMVFEDVPRIVRRSGDAFLAGSNNSMLLLGRDRVSRVDTGYGSIDSSGGGRGAGALHAIVGRRSSDPSVADDAATLYMSAKTDADLIAGMDSLGQARKAVPAIVMRADCMRISARTDMKVSVGKAYVLISASGEIVIEGDVSLGQDAAERILRGDAFAKFWSTVTVPTPMGPSGPPPPIPENLLSPRNRVK